MEKLLPLIFFFHLFAYSAAQNGSADSFLENSEKIINLKDNAGTNYGMLLIHERNKEIQLIFTPHNQGVKLQGHEERKIRKLLIKVYLKESGQKKVKIVKKIYTEKDGRKHFKGLILRKK